MSGLGHCRGKDLALVPADGRHIDAAIIMMAPSSGRSPLDGPRRRADCFTGLGELTTRLLVEAAGHRSV